jgi:hypothetical protein
MAKPTVEEMWRQMVTGDYPRLHRIRRMWGALPSPPRCKLCNAPFRGPGGGSFSHTARGRCSLDGIRRQVVMDTSVTLWTPSGQPRNRMNSRI